jgi:Peptidase_C39 like family
MRRTLFSGLLCVLSAAHALTMTFATSTTTVLTAPADFKQAGLNVAGPLLTGPETVAQPFTELIPSWNAVTPPGSSVTVEVRVKQAGKWTRWYSFGTWTSQDGRSSLNGQQDAAASVSTDTLKLKAPAGAYQYRATLRGAATLSLLAFTTSSKGSPTRPAASDRAAWGKVLNVPERSQMIYPGGGENWCSPTSTSMILAYWGIDVTVPQAARATYDKAYDGTGNWSFNAAYAGSLGLRAYVARLPGLAAAEGYIAAGIPLAVSLGWKPGELPGAPIAASSGHLMVLVGFDAAGNPVLNDPAAASNETVRRTYPRSNFERLWQTHSGGTVYVMAPVGKALP